MDLTERTAAVQSTSVGRGLYNPGVKYLGTYYVAQGRTSRLSCHSTMTCKTIRDVAKYTRRIIFQRDDKIFWISEHDNEVQTDICVHCPEYLSIKWREEGNCFNSLDERSMSNLPSQYEGFIKEYCGDCPVVIECFEYGVNDEAVGVWGGVNLPFRKKWRERAIAGRMKELEGSIATQPEGAGREVA